MLPPVEEYPLERAREKFFWIPLAAALALVAAIGEPDYQAARVTAAIVKEAEGGQAPAFGVVDPFAGAELGAPLRLISPLTCQAPTAQWIWQWGDGKTPFERQAGHRLARQCVNADLRRKAHARKSRS